MKKSGNWTTELGNTTSFSTTNDPWIIFETRDLLCLVLTCSEHPQVQYSSLSDFHLSLILPPL